MRNVEIYVNDNAVKSNINDETFIGELQSSIQSGQPKGLGYISEDGKTIYVSRHNADGIQIKMTTAGDLSTGTQYNYADLGQGGCIWMSQDETKMSFVDSDTLLTSVWSVGTPHDMSTRTLLYSGTTFDGYSGVFSQDGMYWFQKGAINNIRRWDLTTAFDISGITSGGYSQSVSTAYSYTFHFNKDGTEAYSRSAYAGSITTYTLSTAYDLTTMTTLITESTNYPPSNFCGWHYSYNGVWNLLTDFSLTQDNIIITKHIGYQINTEDWTRLDLFDDETIQLTDSIQDVKDIKKVFTAFSQTFKVPASDNNNKLFKHYYNADIDGYDGRFRKDALIKIDGVDFKFGKITLNSASLHHNLPTDYDITFYGKTIELTEILGEDTLRDLSGTSVDNYSFDFNQDTIREGLSRGYVYNSVTGILDTVNDDTYDLCFPFISSSSYYYQSNNDDDYIKANVDTRNTDFNTYTSGNYPPYGVHYDDLKPALRVSKIIDAIEERYPIVFSNDFFDSSNKPFNDLFLWLQRESGTLSQQIGTKEAELAVGDFVYSSGTEAKSRNRFSRLRNLQNR